MPPSNKPLHESMWPKTSKDQMALPGPKELTQNIEFQIPTKFYSWFAISMSYLSFTVFYHRFCGQLCCISYLPFRWLSARLQYPLLMHWRYCSLALSHQFLVYIAIAHRHHHHHHTTVIIIIIVIITTQNCHYCHPCLFLCMTTSLVQFNCYPLVILSVLKLRF